tara:strand:- start:225 stop:875 length:651 start_codon:yes stop_codon:yes gene_type:complete
MFMPPELTRMRNEDPAAFDALMQQRRAELDAMGTGKYLKRLEEQGGNVFDMTKEAPERSFEGDLKKTFGGLTPHPSVMTPNIRTKIEDFLGQMGDSTGPFPWKDFDEYLGRPGSRPEDRILHEEQWGNNPSMQTSPLDKTLERRVWERDQMPKRTPDAQGRLYPDKNDPGFIDPRIQGDGRMTMQSIPELDNPNWTPENPMPRSWGRGGEGVQYRL